MKLSNEEQRARLLAGKSVLVKEINIKILEECARESWVIGVKNDGINISLIREYR